MEYGCISTVIFEEFNLSDDIKYILDDICLNIEKPNIDYKYEIKYLTKIIKKYNLQERIDIARKYDNILIHFTNIYPNIDNDRINLLKKICNYLVLKLKIKFNLSRPFQVSSYYKSCIHPVNLITTHTPTLPSGHTALFYLYYKYFSFIDPMNEINYYSIYENGANSRLIGGNHFYIDNQYSVRIIDILLNKIKLF